MAPEVDEDNPLAMSLLELNAAPEAPRVLPADEEWDERRRLILRVWQDHMGELDEPGSGEIRPRRTEQEPDAGIERRHVHIDGGAAGDIPAEILVPTHVDQPRPAVVACHPTNVDGKRAVSTTVGERRTPYALELAMRGYVVAVPDMLTAGERVFPGHDPFHTAPFYEQHPRSTMIARNHVDMVSTVNALCGMSEVDPTRIAAIGHSLGGYTATFLAGLDDRVGAVVNSCGFAPFRHDLKPTRWGLRGWYSHLPRVNSELARGRVPFEFSQIASLMAPKPIFNYSGQLDAIFPHWRAITEALGEMGRLYETLGHADRFVSLMGWGPHAFPPEIRQQSYDFLDHWLGAPDTDSTTGNAVNDDRRGDAT
ncbi:alpha/beta hydrolase family protein [Propionibacteriaceae bacterium Y2011]